MNHIGSLNLDPRSNYENTEIGLIIENPDIAAQLIERINSVLEKSTFRVELVAHDDGYEQLKWHGHEKWRTGYIRHRSSYNFLAKTRYWPVEAITARIATLISSHFKQRLTQLFQLFIVIVR